MAVYEVENTQILAPLYAGWEETMIWSCLQGCMGAAYADDLERPQSAQILVGGFCFFAGSATQALVRNRPPAHASGAVIMVPQHRGWEEAIEHVYGKRAVRGMRYATKKEPGVFREAQLRALVSRLPGRYALAMIDGALYAQILRLDWAQDLCGNYPSYEAYREHGLGVAVLKNEEVVSGASSYTFYRGGIEIEIDTRADERRKGLALACGAQLILECLKRGLYPSWDAHTKASLALAERLGYRFDREYPAYEVGEE